MELTLQDFSGYSETCNDIKKIKAWIGTKENKFTAEELINEFGSIHSQFKKKVIEYLRPSLIKKYVNDVLKIDAEFIFEELENKILRLENKYKQFEGVDNIDELLNIKSKLESDYKSKHYYLEKEIEKYKDFKNFDELLQLNINLKNGWNYRSGTVIQVLNYFFSQSFKSQSYVTTNSVMRSVMYDLCRVAKFYEDDFKEIFKKFNYGYWGETESFYSTMINAGNNSAWKSFEKAICRTPFILNNKRIYEGMTFKVVEDNKWIYYRCTGWNESKKIKFVTEKEEKQRRFSFDNKEFKAYFKNKKVDF